MLTRDKKNYSYSVNQRAKITQTPQCFMIVKFYADIMINDDDVYNYYVSMTTQGNWGNIS